jgi:hypothetical protein
MGLLVHRVFLLLACAACAALAHAVNAAPQTAPLPSYSPVHYGRAWPYRNRRNDALGAWLPQYEDLFEPWRRHRAVDGPLGWNEMFTVPANSTFFWYGDAGPPKVDLVYDPARRVALFSQGCCSWQETILATVSKPPPSLVKTANLSAVRTRRGIGLGASPNAVRRAYGAAALYPSTTKRGFRVLSYYRKQVTTGTDCGWFENFVFRANQLVEIQAGHGC